MQPHADPGDPNVHSRHHQIPQEVTRRKPLNHPTSARVTIYPLHRAHVLPFLIHKHDPQRRRVDRARLHQRHDAHIPVYLCASTESRVDLWEEIGGDQRGQDGLNELVEDEGGDDLVDVERKGGEGECCG